MCTRDNKKTKTNNDMGNCKSPRSTIRVAQWNILADGLGQDGFVATEFVPIRETSAATSKKYGAVEFMELIRIAKQEDTKTGIMKALGDLKKAEKKLKKLPDASSADASKLKNEITSLKETVSKSKLVKLKKQFERSPELERIDSEILDWNVRYSKIKALLLRTDPDVITFQEIDHVQQFLNDGIFSSKYTCLVDHTQTYETPFYAEDAHDQSKDTRRPDNYMSELLQRKAAFCPKSYSNAYNFRKKRPRPGTHLDDDGVAIFWKKDRFEPLELGFLRYPTKEGDSKREGAVAVTLQHKTSAQKIHVLTAHLPSGDETAKEQERLNVLRNPSAEFLAQRVVRQGDKNGVLAWEPAPYQGKKFDGLLSFVQYYSSMSETSRTIFALDTNSRPTFPLTEAGNQKTNVWNSILEQSDLESVWVQSSILDTDGKATNPKLPFVASVNKMRGPSSDQPTKIGEHQLELIDHVFTNARNSRLVKDVELGESIMAPLAPLQYASKEGKAEISLNPSLSMPSDHLPVVVDIDL
jgi:endonuclease/exonuclease/phosphatase family metal-dependent hydrolase